MNFDCLTTEDLRLLLISSKERITRIEEELEKRKQKMPTVTGWYWCQNNTIYWWSIIEHKWYSMDFEHLNIKSCNKKLQNFLEPRKNKDGSFQRIDNPEYPL